MEIIINQLKAKAEVAPDDSLLMDTISLLLDLQRNPDRPHLISWGALHRCFVQLQDRGLWERTAENDELLDALRTFLTAPTSSSVDSVRPKPNPTVDFKPPSVKFSIARPPAQVIRPQLISNQDPLVLPLELVDILNNAYFLHLLATDSSQILPPGKSLLSVMSRSNIASEGNSGPALDRKVEDLVHKVFWEEALETLSNAEPSVQLSRLKLLYGDMHIALSPLLPPNHPVLVILSSPLPPTSSPLDTTVMHLREVLSSLRKRCAPVRDPDIEALQRMLDDPPIRSSPPVELATLVSETFKSILRLSELMKEDLSQFVLGSMTEQQLKSVIAKQAKATEREIVLDLWGRDRIERPWALWLEGLQPQANLSSAAFEPRFSWIVRVVQALGFSSPVSCALPPRTVQLSPTPSSDTDALQTSALSTPSANVIPPIFFFTTPVLLKVQNYLQALVIAASLRSLTRLPTPTRASHTNSASDPDSFSSRVWTLLRAEIAGEPGAGDTKLINLADEVIRARMQADSKSSASPSLSKEDETKLRAAVDRTLKPDDPVYRLLQTRLLTALVNALLKRRQAVQHPETGTPVTLRTGKDGERVGQRPRLVLDPEDMDNVRPAAQSSSGLAIDVKGFEDPILSRAAAEVFEKVDACLAWVESIWRDVVETGRANDPSR
ncbi:hypothetical protein PAXRUDRAFT_822874 [Paxillus rubicundulus Ve08.2h10]|uniref:Uncharacterized protein n=1 Tax=Paxillus rubicundulus Ve08.2h10 TaxID=930991 RepID=A0A0D0E9E1_9AGAM|nr:hypothetical protein PAXRUDRAFT_822874 [Paxillus rubicundulus Ve08.2h10]